LPQPSACAGIAGRSDANTGLIQLQALSKSPFIDGFIQSQGGPMESLASLNCPEQAVCNTPLSNASIWQDILAQAVTGELMAAMNYSALSTICDDPGEVADALEHAQGEQGHAAAFAAEGRKIGVTVPNNVNARYWKRIREAFMRCIAGRDFMGCLIVQEIMLESFAVASYTRVGKAAPGSLGRTFAAIAAEEEGHIEHAMEILRAERASDPQRFDEKVYRLHLDVMTTLTEMVARDCRNGQCELCHSSCVKPSLSEVGLTTAELRGASLQQYLKTLDALGLPGEVTLQWVTQLPV
jgi:fatty aldehyde decarbonylase